MALRLFTAFCTAITFAATLYTIWLAGPWIETRYYPAVSRLKVLSSTVDRETGGASITVEFTKLRACEWIGIAWYRGKQDGLFERVPVTLGRRAGDTSSPNRSTGRQSAGPWIIGLSLDDLRSNSFAQLTHRCHPFWITTTDFYP